MSSFFKNIAVTYYTAQIYNDTIEDMKAEIDEQFSSPLLDAASNYVCAVERMELSGNNIFFYSVDTDNDADVDDTIDPERNYTTIYFLNSSMDKGLNNFEMYVYGSYFSLAELIEGLNYWATIPDSKDAVGTYLSFSLTAGGKIRITIQNTSDLRWGLDIAMAFDSTKLASIFGLPLMPTGKCKKFFGDYSDYTWYENLAFQTKSSRMDCGIIPTLLQLRSTLPFESDQVSNAKANIVTDFNIVPGSSAEFNYVELGITKTDIGANTYQMYSNKASGISQGCGSMLIYTPNERRWLNFSAPIPIYNIRMWIELITNDPDAVDDSTHYKIPPGGKFSIKLGFYLRDT